MATGHLEVLVEPFKESQPGPHVRAVVDTLTASGLTVDMGPFATSAHGDLAAVVEAAGAPAAVGIRRRRRFHPAPGVETRPLAEEPCER
jgi:uncharacterized protein YqgV (UPF0045/DUF77 family)